MAKGKYRFYARKWLNREHEHSTGFIWAQVPETEGKLDDPYSDDIEFRIADCSRQIDLEFPLWGAEDRKNSWHKINLIIDVATQFRDALAEEILMAEKREKERKAATKAKKATHAHKTLDEIREARA